jgi:hypothetical protein
MLISSNLDGAKTYLIVIFMLVFAATGAYLGRLTGNEAIELIMVALSIAGLRDAIAKK